MAGISFAGEVTITLDERIKIASIGLKEYHWEARWATPFPDEIVLGHFRDFYAQLKTEIGDYFNRETKVNPDSTYLFNVNGTGIAVPLDEFIDPKKLQGHIDEVQAVVIGVNTPYVDLRYELSNNNPEPSLREVFIASHLDLSQQLPALIQGTFDPYISQKNLPGLAQSLGLVLSGYGR